MYPELVKCEDREVFQRSLRKQSDTSVCTPQGQLVWVRNYGLLFPSSKQPTHAVSLVVQKWKLISAYYLDLGIKIKHTRYWVSDDIINTSKKIDHAKGNFNQRDGIVIICFPERIILLKRLRLTVLHYCDLTETWRLKK